MENFSVSIIVASYNYEKFISETLKSLLAQTYRDFEVIVVDDGSKDNSLEVIKDFMKQDARVRLLRHDGGINKGLPETLRLGIKNAKYDWVAFCESDDIWELEHLSAVVGYIKANPTVGFVANDIEMFGDETAVKSRLNVSPFFHILKKYTTPRNVFAEIYFKNIIPTFSCIIVRRDILMGCNFSSYVPAWLDWWLWRQIALKNDFGFVDKKLTKWRIHSSSYINKSEKNAKNRTKEFIRENNRLLGELSFGVKMDILKQIILKRIFYKKFKNGKWKVKVLGIPVWR